MLRRRRLGRRFAAEAEVIDCKEGGGDAQLHGFGEQVANGHRVLVFAIHLRLSHQYRHEGHQHRRDHGRAQLSSALVREPYGEPHPRQEPAGCSRASTGCTPAQRTSCVGVKGPLQPFIFYVRARRSGPWRHPSSDLAWGTSPSTRRCRCIISRTGRQWGGAVCRASAQ
jgi:hypothetical protein